MQQPLDILKQYWQHDGFRKPQEAIINAVINNEDVLAMLPTGGGKSICFQIPAIIKDGICIVISPLVALMKDQVQNLNNRGIKAIALTSGIPFNEVNTLLDNCIYGNYSFLYISPERLQQELVQERIKQMNVNLIAVDEAHCISQWGNDFRPAYRNISMLRDLKPDVNVIALTASATKKVVTDICEQLGFHSPAVFKKSLQRSNIAYMVFRVEDKYHKIGQILAKNGEPSIIYVRNRKSAIEVDRHLKQKGFSSTFYHGGVPTDEKEKRMQLWMNEKVQVMVATNAFGMGIDKPNVRTVIHIHLPDTIENYFQEAGRAGRDNKKSFAVLLVNNGDEPQVKQQFLEALPSVNDVKAVYRKLCNYFQISYGEGQQTIHQFQFNIFCSTYRFNPIRTYNALRILDRESIINLSQQFNKQTKLQFITSNHELLSYLDRNPAVETITRAILRTYGGVFDQETTLNLHLIASKTSSTKAEVTKILKQLEKDAMITYNALVTDATITFLVPREDEQTINPIARDIQQQNRLKKQQIDTVIQYAKNDDLCKSTQLLSYFGEENITDCGICSVCIQDKEKLSKEMIALIKSDIMELVGQQPQSSRKLAASLPYKERHLLEVLTLLLENDMIGMNQKNEYLVNQE